MPTLVQSTSVFDWRPPLQVASRQVFWSATLWRNRAFCTKWQETCSRACARGFGGALAPSGAIARSGRKHAVELAPEPWRGSLGCLAQARKSRGNVPTFRYEGGIRSVPTCKTGGHLRLFRAVAWPFLGAVSPHESSDKTIRPRMAVLRSNPVSTFTLCAAVGVSLFGCASQASAPSASPARAAEAETRPAEPAASAPSASPANRRVATARSRC